VFLLRDNNNNTLIHDRRDFGSRLKSLIGFRPRNLRLYEMAFIHRSASFSLPDGSRINNERLEYLGDAIIESIISEYLFNLYPDASEGFMTKTRSRVVNRDMLNRLAISMQMGSLMVTKMQSTGNSRNLYGNALEALVGALFIDVGYDKTSRFFINKVLKKHLNLNSILEAVTDYKSLILEYGQKHRHPVSFSFSEDSDPQTSRPAFTVTLEINNAISTTGHGDSKKEAEQDASMKAWEQIKTTM
jgi:ribonuclease-3